MKKIRILFLSLLTLLILTGCSSKISESDWSQIEVGMSVKEVEKIIGKPKSQTDDNATISENVYATYKTLYEANSLIPNKMVEDKMEKLDEVYDASENGKNVKEYVYDLKRTDGYENETQIYFVGGSVRYVNYLME